MSPKLNLAMIEVTKISHGILLLKALGEGTLMLSVLKARPGHCHASADCTLEELIGKTEAEIYELFDKRMDKVLEAEGKRVSRDSPRRQ